MKIVTWIVQILLALAFVLGAFFRLVTPYEELIAMEGLGWATDFTSTQIKIIAGLELLAIVGLFLPIIINKFKFFVPLAALGLAGVMIAAMVVHIGRGEPIYINIVLLVLALATAYLRRGFFGKSVKQ